MNIPSIYLIKADLTEKEQDEVQAALEITPLAAVLITAPAHIQIARLLTGNVLGKFGLDNDVVVDLARCLAVHKSPVAVIGDYIHPLSSFDEESKETVLIKHQE